METIYHGPLDIKKGISMSSENYHITLTRRKDYLLCEIERTDRAQPKLTFRQRLFMDPLRLKALENQFRTSAKLDVPHIQELNGTTQIELSLDSFRGYLRATVSNNPPQQTKEELEKNAPAEPRILYNQQIPLPEDLN